MDQKSKPTKRMESIKYSNSVPREGHLVKDSAYDGRLCAEELEKASKWSRPLSSILKDE